VANRVGLPTTEEPCPAEAGMPGHGLGYLAWHADADRRSKAGQRQKYCTRCRRWRWPDGYAACRLAQPIDAGQYRKRLRVTAQQEG
jgi:hypothetical protein